MKRRGLIIWALCCVGITFIIFASIGVFYTGYAIEENNKKIEHNQLLNNQKMCGIFDLILQEGREGDFKTRVRQIYNDPLYRCRDVEK